MSGISINATTAKICNDLPESRHLDFRRQASSPGKTSQVNHVMLSQANNNNYNLNDVRQYALQYLSEITASVSSANHDQVACNRSVDKTGCSLNGDYMSGTQLLRPMT